MGGFAFGNGAGNDTYFHPYFSPYAGNPYGYGMGYTQIGRYGNAFRIATNKGYDDFGWMATDESPWWQ